MWVGLGADSKVVMAIDVPMQLNGKVIDEAILMASSRLKFLLGQQYRRQIEKRVSQRKPRNREAVA